MAIVPSFKVRRNQQMGFKKRLPSFLISATFLFILSCAASEIKPSVTSPAPATPPLPIVQLASHAGFRVFDFSRDVFKPGTIVQINASGEVVQSPAGSLEMCRTGAGGGKEAPLKVNRGEGSSGNTEALVKEGVQINLQTLEKVLPIQFGPDARSAAYVVMKVAQTSSDYLGQSQVEEWLSRYWNRLSKICRSALADSEKAIIDEVIYGEKGFELRFLNSDLKELDLSSVPIKNLVALGADSVGVQSAGHRLLFQTPLPIWYTLYQSCRSFDARRAGDEPYRQCVGKLSAASQLPVVAEAVGRVKKQYASLLEGITAKELPAEEIKTLNSMADFLLTIDPRDGHGLYYKGEALRLQYRKEPTGAGFLGSHDHFNKYLSLLEKVSQENPPRPIGCANEAIGYCPERTAQISNHLAQDFYRAALAKPRDERKEDLCQAAKYAEFALRLRTAGELRDPLQGIPTEDMIEEAHGQLARLRLGPCR
jgi:hypothetical protein